MGLINAGIFLYFISLKQFIGKNGEISCYKRGK